MICTVFYKSGFKRTLCGSKWDPTNGITGNNNAFNYLGSSTARYGCCPANKYMSSPEGTGTFVEADSCSACPAGTHVSLATSILNDETSCDCVAGTFGDPKSTGCQLCASGTCSAAGSASCAPCSKGTCSAAGSSSCAPCSKMPDGCKGFSEQSAGWLNRDCYPRKAVDDWIAGGAKKDNVVQKFGPIENWDMSQVTDMGYLFHWKRTLNSDLSSWVVSSVTTLAGST